MAFIDTVKRINTEEFADEDKEVASRIASYYNFFAENVTNIVNGRLDYDNLSIKSTIQLTVTVDANGTPITNTQFVTDAGLSGTAVIRAVNTQNTAQYATSQPFISFTADGTGTYTINNITGLQASQPYLLTIELTF